ncbi:MAG: hypothetical protein HJJLKODD_00140 [Phycisphaerae bacterium]|nr:hypothetical protein [Phycisphaerae bacterium]
MSLVVTGSIGIDHVQTPFGQVQNVLGGSAIYFSCSASLFTPVRLVGVVGEDFPPEFRSLLTRRAIDLAGLETRHGSKTFRWSGRYEGDMNQAETVSVNLNVLAENAPTIPQAFRDSQYVFLANTHPALQQNMAGQFTQAQLIVCDTMNLWINEQREALTRLLSSVTGIVLNDGEVRLFTHEFNLIKAGRRVLGYGPQFVIIKKGEHGCLLVTQEQVWALPAFPAERVKDPTGAGDSFAGGMMGYLASCGNFTMNQLPRALAYGTITASLAIEEFSLHGLERATRDLVEKRFQQYLAMLHIE